MSGRPALKRRAVCFHWPVYTSLMFTREPVTRPPYVSGTRIVSNEDIDSMINGG